MSEKKNSKIWSARLFNNPKFSDVTIKIFDVVLHAHQTVICSQSEYFEKALQEGSQQFLEAGTKTIEFKEGSGAAYWRVFEYLYTGNYSDKLTTTELTDDLNVLKDVRVCVLADMFLIKELKALSETKFTKKIQGCQVDDVFSACVREVYTNIHQENSRMRREVVKLAFLESEREGECVNTEKDMSKILKLSALMKDVGLFARDYFLWTIDLVPP
ncbi:hypothetical protein K3495_g9800 [Podosphaera aphanis]|nr:hypothetical protein K3495_g9800 [Podosphaera aphanis]